MLGDKEMIKRCIMIFPEFNNIEVINNIRKKYDPLAHHVRPHITLVFSFQSKIKTDELRKHVENVLLKTNPFEITLKNITSARNKFGNYLFLNIVEGMDEIKQIHKNLYTDILDVYKPVWLRGKESYHPHMTVGVVENEKDYEFAIKETEKINEIFTTVVERVSIEIIDNNKDSIIEMEIGLKDNKNY